MVANKPLSGSGVTQANGGDDGMGHSGGMREHLSKLEGAVSMDSEHDQHRCRARLLWP